ncbi:isochorismatase family protein [Paraburkholderia nemoris]|uniref:isochorismatase family protein n=1 Tax=Paraburkholderia nemoris TaxID=2793076 RepID=UPI0038B819FD
MNAGQCVLATLLDATFHGYDAVLLKDCIATSSPDYCIDATIYNVQSVFGFVTDSWRVVENFPDEGLNRHPWREHLTYLVSFNKVVHV